VIEAHLNLYRNIINKCAVNHIRHFYYAKSTKTFLFEGSKFPFEYKIQLCSLVVFLFKLLWVTENKTENKTEWIGGNVVPAPATLLVAFFVLSLLDSDSPFCRFPSLVVLIQTSENVYHRNRLRLKSVSQAENFHLPLQMNDATRSS